MKSDAHTAFRVHYRDGASVDVTAISPAAARDAARVRREGVIAKVKVIREKDDA